MSGADRSVEAFSDGVLAVLITILVLELPKPKGATWAALGADWHVLGSELAAAVGRDLEGRISPVLYLTGIVVSCFVPWLGLAIDFVIAGIRLIPGRRVERQLAHQPVGTGQDD